MSIEHAACENVYIENGEWFGMDVMQLFFFSFLALCFLSGAEVRGVDLQSITGGILHTKLWVVDKKHMYLGSANMDWRSLTQVRLNKVTLCVII